MTIMRENILWAVDHIETVNSDKGFYQWEKVTAVWSGIGPMPTYSKEPRTFFINKRQVKDFDGNPLNKPRYIN